MIYRSGKTEDASDIITLAREEYGQELQIGKISDNLVKQPSKVALDRSGLLGFVLCEEISNDVLLVHTLIVRKEYRCDKIGRCLLELIESQAADMGYHGVVVSGFVQNALLGCEDDILTFAGYSDIYNTGGSRLLVKSVN